jgi:PPOX class probable F420-dependent enzyme
MSSALSSAQETFVKEANVAVISTVDARGRPHATPVWYLYDDGEFRISIDRSSIKYRNIAANSNVSLVIDQRAMPYYALMLRGQVQIGAALSDADRIKLAVRYLGEDLGKRYAESVREGDSVTLHLRPSSVVAHDPLGSRPG